jgi:LysM repeat protein
VSRNWRFHAKRYGAPIAFLLAVTVAVVLVRSGLNSTSSAGGTGVPTSTVPTQQVTTKPVPVKRRRYYRLRSGETLSDVAIKFDTTVEQLVALNPGIQPTNLIVGQRVRVK